LVGTDRWNEVPILIHTANKSDNLRPGNLIFYDWMDSKDRDIVFEHLFQKSNLNLDLNVQDRRNLEHARAFVITLENGSILTIRLDQGVGYWRVENPRYSNRRSTRENITFEFKSVNQGEAGLEKEALQILDKNPALVGNNYSTQIFIKYRPGNN
jgi:DEAD/DEAH box helicase domain-containing protein